MANKHEVEEIEQLWPHLKEVNYGGVYWRDIDWDLPVHCPTYCDYCGSDAMEGHQNACQYLFKFQTSPAGRDFLQDSIRRALIREGKGSHKRFTEKEMKEPIIKT